MIGSICLGVVWGWWTAPFTEPPHRLMVALAVAAAAALQAAESLWIAGSTSLVWLFLGWLIGFVLHRAVRAGIGARATS